MNTIELPIRNMHCQGCVDTVARALCSAPGVRSVNVDLTGQRAEIEFEGEPLPREQLASRVRAAGYEVPDSEPVVIPLTIGSSASANAPVAASPRKVPAMPQRHAQQPTESAKQPIRFQITGMHCASCVGRVESALAAVPGVAGARVSLASEQAVVELNDPAVPAADLQRAV